MTVFVLLLVAWLSFGRRLSLLLDRVVPVRVTHLPTNPIQYDGGGFLIGSHAMAFGLTNNLRADLRLTSDSSNRVILYARNGAFVLGPRLNPVDTQGRPEIIVAPDPGDELAFTSKESLLGWPTPYSLRTNTGTFEGGRCFGSA